MQGDEGAPDRPAGPNMQVAPSDGMDEGWLALDDDAEAPPDDRGAAAGTASPEPTPPPRIAPPPPIARPPRIAPPPPITPSSPIVEVEWTEHAPVAPGDAEAAKPPSAGESESTPAPSPRRKRSRAKVLAFVLLPALVLVGGGFFYQAQTTARSPDRAASQSSADTIGRVDPPVLTSEPRPPPTFTSEPPPSASAVKKPAAGAGETAGAGAAAALSADPSKTGILDTTALPAGRKMVVDGRVVGTSPRRVVVRCGVHRIRIGDLPPESIELPCGGEVTFTE